MTTARPVELPAQRRPRARSQQRRLAGIDVARFVAVFGMFNIHFGVPFVDGKPEAWIAQFSSGRATALFTFLAGVSLALLSGREYPPAGLALRNARIRVTVRAGLLFVVGIALAKATEATGFLLTVIIAFYGLYFFLAVPFLGLKARSLAGCAIVAATVGPQLSFVLRLWTDTGTAMTALVGTVNLIDPGYHIAKLGFYDLLLRGFYPAASYLSLVLAGMAVGRLDLRSKMVRRWLAAGGSALAVVAYTASSLLVRAVHGVPYPAAAGTVPIQHPDWLLAATPHSGTTFELLGSLGIALTILALCLEVADSWRILLAPLAAAGSMALSLYAAHALVMTWQVVVGGWSLSGVPDFLTQLTSTGPTAHPHPDLPAFPSNGVQPDGLPRMINVYMAEIFLIGSVLFATLWRRLFARGPLEAAVSESVRWISRYLSEHERKRAADGDPTQRLNHARLRRKRGDVTARTPPRKRTRV